LFAELDGLVAASKRERERERERKILLSIKKIKK
jgi:hypothetical protein